MLKDKFNIMWIGHCESQNKIWGWFNYTDSELNQQYYAFWIFKIKKTICFKSYNRFTSKAHFNSLKDTKIKNGYIEIKIDDLLIVWPEFFDNLRNDFMSDKLKEKI